MGKYLTQADFLTGILGTPEDLEVPGLGLVSIRALSVAEVTDIQKRHTGDTTAMMLAAISYGLVDPKLDEPAIEAMQNAAAGYVVAIANRIMVLSGMMDGDKLGE
jgi:hypothetical protein